jgi:hypothetical protein
LLTRSQGSGAAERAPRVRKESRKGKVSGLLTGPVAILPMSRKGAFQPRPCWRWKDFLAEQEK